MTRRASETASYLGYRFPLPRANHAPRLVWRARQKLPGAGALALVSVLLAFWCGSAQAAKTASEDVTTVCPTITLIGKIDPPLSDTEKRLVCGDRQGDAWKKIPFDQARFNLTNFLQERGYLHPRFYRESEHNFVNVGAPTRVTSLTAPGAPPKLKVWRKRLVVGEILTPKLLSSVESWVTQKLQGHGYPCPIVRAEADRDTGAVIVHTTPGPRQDLVSVLEEPVPGAEYGVLSRYDAFRLGKLYNGDLLTVTENRILSDSVLQTVHFATTCEADGAHAIEQVTAGPPRLLTLGFGSNTEGVLLAKAEWRNARLGRMASYFDITALASEQQQVFDAHMNWYVLPHPTRFYLRPLAQTRHDNEQYYEYFNTRAQMSAATTWDNQPLGATFSAGPTLDFFRTLSGSGTGNPNSHFLALESELKVRSHGYELNQADPRNGFQVDLITDFNTAAAFSTASAQRFRLTGEALWNVNGYDPPLVVFGVRGGLATTMSPERPGFSSLLPAPFFQYLGGSADLRGWGRQELPLNGLGAMTEGFADFEARLNTVLPFNLEPFVFEDVGALGALPWNLDSPLYWSPGIGLRWKSPIGVFRTTLAHGYASGVPGHLQFYLSYGEEF